MKSDNDEPFKRSSSKNSLTDIFSQENTYKKTETNKSIEISDKPKIRNQNLNLLSLDIDEINDHVLLSDISLKEDGELQVDSKEEVITETGKIDDAKKSESDKRSPSKSPDKSPNKSPNKNKSDSKSPDKIIDKNKSKPL